MFDKDFEEVSHYEDLQIDGKIQLNTLITLRHNNSMLNPNCQSPQIDLSQSEIDISFQNQIYRNNAKLIKLNLVEYLNSCLKKRITIEEIFRDGVLFSFQNGIQDQQESTYSNIVAQIGQNKLLNQSQRKILEDCYKEFQEFRRFLTELSNLFGQALNQELQYSISVILEHKLQAFKSLKITDFITLLPHFPRFYSEDQNEIFLSDTNNFQSVIDYSTIKKFASLGIEDFSAKIYFLKSINFLNLKKITVDIQEQLNLVSKFQCFITILSSTVFLTLAGHTLSEEQFDIFKEEITLNLQEGPQGILNNSLNKKVKYDFL